MNDKLQEALDFMALDNTCTKQGLQTAYLKLSIKYHPDKGGAPGMFQALNEHKKVISDYIDGKNNANIAPSTVLDLYEAIELLKRTMIFQKYGNSMTYGERKILRDIEAFLKSVG